jgi:hypothetical protein
MSKQNLAYLFVVATITFSVLAAAATASQAFAINDKFTSDCTGPEDPQEPGDCAGQSEKSGPHDEIISNPAGNVPPGQQEEED